MQHDKTVLSSRVGRCKLSISVIDCSYRSTCSYVNVPVCCLCHCVSLCLCVQIRLLSFRRPIRLAVCLAVSVSLTVCPAMTITNRWVNSVQFSLSGLVYKDQNYTLSQEICLWSGKEQPGRPVVSVNFAMILAVGASYVLICFCLQCFHAVGLAANLLLSGTGSSG